MELKKIVDTYVVSEKTIPLYNYDIAVINSSEGGKYWQQFF